MHPQGRHTGGRGQGTEATGGAMAVHPVVSNAAQDRAAGTAGHGSVHTPADGGRHGTSQRPCCPCHGPAASAGALRRPARRAAQRVELEALGRLGGRLPGDRAPDLPGARPAAHLRVTLARRRRRSEGGAADPGARLRRDDDGPLRAPLRPQPVGGGREGRGHHGGTRASGPGTQKPQPRDWASDLGLRAEPPVGIEPTTYSLRVNRSTD